MACVLNCSLSSDSNQLTRVPTTVSLRTSPQAGVAISCKIVRKQRGDCHVGPFLMALLAMTCVDFGAANRAINYNLNL